MSKHTLRFYPLGNADTTLISLANGKQILWDYANVKVENDEDDERCDLPTELNKHVKSDYDVVTFTHADKDHIHRFSEYFYLRHAVKYQEGERKKIEELWVPAAVLLDKQSEDEAKALKAEARYRLRKKEGILVFSKPQKMRAWCDEQDDISYDEVKHLFVDAGKIVPSIALDEDGVEFFIHSPFKSESLDIDRNGECIVVQATFNDKCSTQLILGADCTSEVWKRIVEVTKHFDNEDRLKWDIFRVSHHCS